MANVAEEWVENCCRVFEHAYLQVVNLCEKLAVELMQLLSKVLSVPELADKHISVRNHLSMLPLHFLILILGLLQD